MKHSPHALGDAANAGASFVAVRMRRVGLALTTSVLLLFIWADVAAWRLALMAMLTAAVVAANIVDSPLVAPGSLTRRRVRLAIGVMLALQSLFIGLSGGMQSPLIVATIPTALLAAIVVGDPRAFVGYVALPIVALWAFAWVEVSGPPAGWVPWVFDRSHLPLGHALGTVGLAATITAAMVIGGVMGLLLRRRLDVAQLENLEAARERNRELQSLSGTLAHELKNPLAAIQGLSTLLERNAQEGSSDAERLAVLVREVKRMGGIVDEFLNFSRPLSALELKRRDLVALAAEVAAMHEAMARNGNIELRVAGDAEVSVRCDARKIKQVLINLVQNAFEASEAGGAVRVEVRATDEGGGLITVSDRGRGIPEELAGKLFDPGVSTRAQGSGIGLTIARALTEQHGGELQLSPNEGPGVMARLRLPPAAEAAG